MDYILHGGIEDDVGLLMKIFNSVLLEQKPRCRMEVTRDGISLKVEHNKVVQASVFVQQRLFDSYTVNVSPIEVWFDLLNLLQCLGQYQRDDTSRTVQNLTLSLAIQNQDSDLEVISKSSGIMTKCKISTLQPGSFVEFPPMDTTTTMARLEMTSLLFTDIMDETEMSAKVLGFLWKPDHVLIWTDTVNGRQEIVVREGFEEVISYSFTGTSEKGCFIYKTGLFKPVLKPRSISNRTILTVSHEGLLQVQYSVDSVNGPPIIIGYFIVNKYCSRESNEEESEDIY